MADIEIVAHKKDGYASIFLNGRKVGWLCPSMDGVGYDVWVWRNHQTVQLHETYRTRSLAEAAAIAACHQLDSELQPVR